VTLAAFKRRVAFWAERLKPLGLAHWEIDIEVVDEPSPSTLYGAKAAVTCSSNYDLVWMEVAEGWLHDSDLEEIDKVIMHELIHVAMRDLDDSIHRVTQYLGEPAVSVWKEELRHETEGFVDRIARTLYLTSRSNVVQS
jgi:hypothetical protein